MGSCTCKSTEAGGHYEEERMAREQEDQDRLKVDLRRIAREKEQKEKVAREKEQKEIALEEERTAREKEEERAREATIGLTVQQEDGQPEVEVEVRPWEPVHGSLGKALELGRAHRLTEAWLGELRLEGEGSWESQGVVDGASVRAVVEEKIALIVVTDTDNDRVQVLRLEDGSHVRTIGSYGSGPGQFEHPCGVAVDGQGHLIVADTYNDRVQVLRLEDGSHVRSIGSRRGSGPGQFLNPRGSRPGRFNWPYGVAVDGQGHLIVADTYNHRVQVFRLEDASHVRTIGSEGSGPGQFKRPRGVAVDGQGHLIVADNGNHRVQVLRLEDGSHVRSIGSKGTGTGQFSCPSFVAVDEDLIVGDLNNHRVQVLRLEDGSHVRTIGSKGSGPGQFNQPCGVAVVYN